MVSTFLFLLIGLMAGYLDMPTPFWILFYTSFICSSIVTIFKKVSDNSKDEDQ